ncbi:MAG: EAL domain-containing protein [Nitrospinota bacterium]|nr:EAL domain-containing protein [Nitrospinota bacterium]
MPSAEDILWATFHCARHGMILVRLDQRLVKVNSKFCALLGYGESELLERALTDLTNPEDTALAQKLFDNLSIGKMKRFEVVLRLTSKAGESLLAHLTANPVMDAGGKPGLCAIAVEDVTEKDDTEEKLRIAAKIYESSEEGVVVTDREGIIQFVNPAFTTITGYSPEEALGRNPSILRSGRHTQEFYELMWGSLRAEGRWEGEIWNRNKNGEAYLERLRITSIKDTAGRTTHYTAIFSDLTQIRDTEEKIRYQAYHDILTGLPNRSLYFDRVRQAITRAQRAGKKLGVMFLDLDDFKKINDRLNHSAGDLMLQGVATRLVSCLRETDTVARIGGDEFTILLEDVDGEKQSSVVAEKIMRSISEPYFYNSEELFVSTSLGISIYPADGATVEDLIKNADIAMYHAKDLGKNNYQFFTESMNQKVVKRLEAETNLRKALDKDEMFACYQPKVDLKTGRIVGMEALIRWRRDGLDIVLPNEFIPLAEETGLILGLDEWMLGKACTFNRRIHEGGDEEFSVAVNVAVNVSAKAFESPDLVKSIQDVVALSGLPPRFIELEVTESSIIRNMDQAVMVLSRLRELGFNISMDDFGTGYSSLSYLARLPINILKIDRSFIVDLAANPKSRSIAKAIVSMSHEMDIKVVAEGVENTEQLEYLRGIDCDEVQGYLFCRPLLENDMEVLIKSRVQYQSS